MLNVTNFKKWKEHITILLRCIDLDYAIRNERPPALIDDSIAEQRANFEKWERSNHMSLMIIKHSCGPSPDPPDRRDSLLKEKKEMKKLVFSSFEKPTPGEERCCLESPLTFYFCF